MQIQFACWCEDGASLHLPRPYKNRPITIAAYRVGEAKPLESHS